MWSDASGITLVGISAYLLVASNAKGKPLNAAWLGALDGVAYVVPTKTAPFSAVRDARQH